MQGRVDFHSHFLPGADHGSDGTETSVSQLRMLYSAGVEKAVATPHFYPQRMTIGQFLLRRAKCAKDLLPLLGDGMPEVYLGAEVLICSGMEEMRDLPRLCVAGTNCLLLEMPFRRFDQPLLETVSRIAERGDLRVVMAHIDRYDADDVAALMELDVDAQINAESLASFSARRQLARYIDDGRVCAFASDLHKTDKTTLKNYQKGLKKIGEAREKAVNDAALALLNDAQPMREMAFE